MKKWKGITSWQIAVRRAHAKVDYSAVSDSAHWWYFSSLISSCHVSDVFHFSIGKLKTKVWCDFCFFRKQEAHVRHKRHLDTIISFDVQVLNWRQFWKGNILVQHSNRRDVSIWQRFFFHGDSRHSLFLDNSNVVEIVQIYTNLLILFSSLFIYNTYIYIINPNKLDDRGIRKEKRAKKLYKIWTFLIWLIYITSNKSPVCEYVVASCHNMLLVAWNLESRSLHKFQPPHQTHQAQDTPHCTRHHTIYLQRLRLARPPFLITL